MPRTVPLCQFEQGQPGVQAQLPAIADLGTKLEAQGRELSGSWQQLQAAKQQLAAAQADQLAAAAAHDSASSALQAQACLSSMHAIRGRHMLIVSCTECQTEPHFVCLPHQHGSWDSAQSGQSPAGSFERRPTIGCQSPLHAACQQQSLI